MAVLAAREGHLRGVSFGYRIDETKESTVGGKRIVTVTRLTPVELSLTAIGADPKAVIRSPQMEPQQTTQTTQITTTDPPALSDRAAANVEIRSIARLSGLPQTWINSQIDANATAEQARAAAFEAMRVRSAHAENIRTVSASIGGFDSNDPEWRRATIGEAIFCRMTGSNSFRRRQALCRPIPRRDRAGLPQSSRHASNRRAGHDCRARVFRNNERFTIRSTRRD